MNRYSAVPDVRMHVFFNTTMSFEELKNISLLCVVVWVIYKLIWKSNDQRKWQLFVSAGIAVILLFCFTIIRFAMGLCGSASIKDLFLLNARNKLFCNVPLELSYAIITALVVAAFLNGFATLFQFLKRIRK